MDLLLCFLNVNFFSEFSYIFENIPFLEKIQSYNSETGNLITHEIL